MIYRTWEQLTPAYQNCLRTTPSHNFGTWMPRDQGNWWREEHRVFPQGDGTYGFETEQDLAHFLLKWS